MYVSVLEILERLILHGARGISAVVEEVSVRDMTERDKVYMKLPSDIFSFAFILRSKNLPQDR
jgi:hypothetical protein